MSGPGNVGPGADRSRFDPALCGVAGPLESLSFEQLLDALEAVTGKLASGELGIEAATDLYEQAEILHAAAEERLAAVEARIAALRGSLA
jgi:exodeoxyribonuclease VII small subunit